DSGVVAAEEPDDGAERHGTGEVDDRAARRYGRGHLVRLAIDEDQFQRDHRQQATDGGDPQPQGDEHRQQPPDSAHQQLTGGLFRRYGHRPTVPGALGHRADDTAAKEYSPHSASSLPVTPPVAPAGIAHVTRLAGVTSATSDV